MYHLIAAIGLNGEMGFKNKLLWNIPKDLHYFKKITKDANVIMGRKTFESLPNILKNRTHLVLTNRTDFNCKKNQEIHYFQDWKSLLNYTRMKPEKENFFIGGSQIYLQALQDSNIELQSIHLTIVKDYFPFADTWFPLKSLHEKLHRFKLHQLEDLSPNAYVQVFRPSRFN